MKSLYCVVLSFCLLPLLKAQEGETVKKKEPFRVLGNIGASANFYTSNESNYIANERNYTRPFFAWNVYGSMVGRAGDFSLPVSFVVNQYSKSNFSPYVQAGISPTYKWARLHLGYRSISLSPLIFDGQSFKGVGIELNPKLFRFAAFYGGLNRSIAEDTSILRYRMPQYSRVGYGVKIGIGNYANFFDVMYFHARDDSNSSRSLNSLPAQENSIVGSSLKLTIAKKLILTGDFAVSGLTQDLSFIKITADSANAVYKNLISKLLDYNASTLGSYAGQSSLAFYSRNFNTNIGYRRVQPDFKSLGTPYVINDVELISWFNSFSLAKGKLNISSNFSDQHNNLNKKLRTKLETQVGNVNVNTIWGQHVTVNLNYSGYKVDQSDVKLPINDTLRLEQRTSQFSINPSYSITKGTKLHFIYANVNLSTLKDKNPLSPTPVNTRNLSTSINYTLAFINKPYNFSLNCLFSKYEQALNSYQSYGATVGSSAQMLKKKNLNLQGSVGYLINSFNSSNTQRNLTYSLTTAYQVKKHSLNLFANYVYTPPNAINDAINKATINKNIPSAVVTKNLASGLSYTYTF